MRRDKCLDRCLDKCPTQNRIFVLCWKRPLQGWSSAAYLHPQKAFPSSLYPRKVFSSMSRRYTLQQKADALDHLQASGGNIALTHLQTGVPERTLRFWRRQLWLDSHLPLPPPPPSGGSNKNCRNSKNMPTHSNSCVKTCCKNSFIFLPHGAITSYSPRPTSVRLCCLNFWIVSSNWMHTFLESPLRSASSSNTKTQTAVCTTHFLGHVNMKIPTTRNSPANPLGWTGGIKRQNNLKPPDSTNLNWRAKPSASTRNSSKTCNTRFSPPRHFGEGVGG